VKSFCLSLTLLATLPLVAVAQDAAEAPKTQFDAPLATRVKPRQIELAWKSYASVQSYVVWRKLSIKNAKWRPLKEIKGVSFTDPTLPPGLRASYKVEAVGITAESRPVGPVEALDDLYLELVSVSGATAQLYVHQWREPLSEWVKSARVEVKVGATIKGEDVVGDFETKVRVLRVDREVPAGSPKGAEPRGYMKILTAERRLVKVLEGLKPPNEVWQKKKPKTKTKTVKTAKTTKLPKPTRVRPRKKRKPLKFPEPTLVGPITKKGKKHVEWEIQNKSKHRMHFVITAKRGKSSYDFKVPADTTIGIKVKQGGDYKVVVNVGANKTLPLEGAFGLAAGMRYKSVFAVRTLDPADPRVKKKKLGP
jgi:hypothetical protein